MSHDFSDSLQRMLREKKGSLFPVHEASDTLKCQPQRGHITIGSIGKQTPSVSTRYFAAPRPSMECLCFHLLSMYWNSRLLRFQSNEPRFLPFCSFTYRNIMTASFTELGLSQELLKAV